MTAPADRVPSPARPVRIGIVNLMPKLEAYEPLLLGPLARAPHAVEVVGIRLGSARYGSSDQAHLDRSYVTFAEAIAAGPLDGLVITGAPVEELPYEEVVYWRELTAILEHAGAEVPSTLGLCWGGLALAEILGIPKHNYPAKLFGVFELRRLGAPAEISAGLLAGQAPVFPCAQSRHAGIADAEIERAAARGIVRPLAHAAAGGYSLFETPDHRFVMHLGHPEYVADRLVFEWRRDRDLGRTDVPTPHGFDPEAPVTSWAAHREALFARWIDLLAAARR
jgi:homoserine O-succinyltransferase